MPRAIDDEQLAHALRDADGWRSVDGGWQIRDEARGSIQGLRLAERRMVESAPIRPTRTLSAHADAERPLSSSSSSPPPRRADPSGRRVGVGAFFALGGSFFCVRIPSRRTKVGGYFDSKTDYWCSTS